MIVALQRMKRLLFKMIQKKIAMLFATFFFIIVKLVSFPYFSFFFYRNKYIQM